MIDHANVARKAAANDEIQMVVVYSDKIVNETIDKL